MALASSKHVLGNKLGYRVTGAVVASVLDRSVLVDNRLAEGRTANPLRMDQWLIFESKYSCCSRVVFGGKSGYIEAAIDVSRTIQSVGMVIL